jgi:HK97 gp10 family phage protein
MKFEGFDELRKTFHRLPLRTVDKVLKSAVRAGANPIVKAVRSRAPRRTGTLAKSIMAKVKLYAATGTAVAIIGARSRKVQVASRIGGSRHGQAIFANPAKYAHLVEGGIYGGKAATHFMERGFAAGVTSAESRYIKFLRKGIEREARKGGFK